MPTLQEGKNASGELLDFDDEKEGNFDWIP
jgi:hypothetical protein